MHSKAMAGMRVHAYDKSSGANLNISYQLRSSLPGVTSAEVEGNDPDKQIFSYPIGGGRDKQKWFDTGKKDIYQYKGSSTGAIQCAGWSVLGPGCYVHPQAGGCNGNTLQRGNHHVLNCGFDKTEGDGIISHPARYWISNITKPAGQDGHWEIRVSGALATSNSTTNPMNGGNNYFTVNNGYSKSVDLIWHKKSDPNPDPPHGDCNVFEVGGSKYNRRLVQIYGVDLGRTRTFENGARISDTKYGNHQADGGTHFSSWVISPPGSGNVPPGSYKRIWNYTPTSNTINIQVYQYHFNGSHWVSSTLRNSTINCFSAVCDITSVTGDAPDGRVRAGGPMVVRGTFRNTSPDGNIIWNQALKATDFDVGSNNRIYTVYLGPSYVGYTYDFSIGMTAPSNITSDNFNLTPVYHNAEAIGPPCSNSIAPPGGPGPGPGCSPPCCPGSPPCYPTYEYFELGPSASTTLAPTREDPDISRHRAKITSSGPTVRVPYTARSTLNGGEINSRNETTTTTIDYSYDHTNFSGINAGDEFCTYIYTPNGSGWVGPGYELVDANNPRSFGPSCDNIHDRPYVSTYGGDTVAGIGGFYDAASGSCDSGGEIKTFTNISNPKARGGSGSQLAAISSGDITGFTSASMTAAPTNLKLSFSNTENNTGGSDNRYKLGGRFSQNSCTTNYFEATQYEEGSKKDVINSSGLSVGNLADIKQTLVDPPNALNLNGSPSYNKRHTVYVEGDVVINGDIIYANRGSWNLDDIKIPNFTLVARGNIYIKPNVSQLDGTYIAQPTAPGDANSGKIYTCALNASNPIPDLNALDQICDKQLTVNGSLIAEDIKFLRTKFTLRESRAEEGYQDSKAAEKIVFSPEAYLSPPVFNTPGSRSDSDHLPIGIYEYITTLPPIL